MLVLHRRRMISRCEQINKISYLLAVVFAAFDDVQLASFILCREDFDGLLGEVKSDLVLVHICVDLAEVDVGLRNINFLRIAGYHLFLNFAYFFKVPDGDLIFVLLLVVDAKIAVSHYKAATGNKILAHWSQLLCVQHPCSFKFVAEHFCLVKGDFRF